MPKIMYRLSTVCREGNSSEDQERGGMVRSQQAISLILGWHNKKQKTFKNLIDAQLMHTMKNIIENVDNLIWKLI